MKIMSYEIPIYCWQLKRPGTGAARNFRVPLYLVTNLFRAAGGCRLGLGGSLSLSFSPPGKTWRAPGHQNVRTRHLGVPSEKGSASCPEKISNSKQNVGSAKTSQQKQRKGLFFLFLSTSVQWEGFPRRYLRFAQRWSKIFFFSLSILSSFLFLFLFLNQSISFLFCFFFLFSLSPSSLVFFLFPSTFTLILLPKITI